MLEQNPFTERKNIICAVESQRTVFSRGMAEFIVEYGDLRPCPRGLILANQGEIGASLFYILSGGIHIQIKGHDYCVRGRGELVGEMAVIEPGAPRTATMTSTSDQTFVVELSSSNFEEMCAQFPETWKLAYEVIASRLRQRDDLFVQPNEHPVIFLASSGEAEVTLKKLLVGLDASNRKLEPWNKPGLFKPSRSTWEELERCAHSVDFAIILLTTDDVLESRGTTKLSPRDNVMLELGLFSGALGRERTILLVEDDKDLKLPSDLNGITQLRFSDDKQLSERILEISDLIDNDGRLFRLKRK